MFELKCKNPYFAYNIRAEQVSTSMDSGHIHKRHELYYLAEGERRYFIDGEIFHVHAGDLVLIQKNSLHHTTNVSAAPHKRYLVTFSDEYIPAPIAEHLAACFQKKHFSLRTQEISALTDIFHKIEKTRNISEPLAQVLLQSYVAELLVLLIASGTHAVSAPVPKSRTDLTIEAATQYIAEHLAEPLTMADVADNFHISYPYFSRMFKSYTGFGFAEYLTHLRMQRAARLLTGAEKSVAEIAELCGFTDPNYFSAVFKKRMGVSPKKYRMQK